MHVDPTITAMQAASVQAFPTLAKQRLEDSDKQLAAVIANMPVGVVLTDQTGKIEFSNLTMQRLFGSHEYELSGRRLKDLLRITNNQLIDVLFFKQTVECEAANAIGSRLRLQVSATEIAMSDQANYLVMLQDITEQYQLQRLRQEFVTMIGHELRTPVTSIDINLVVIEDTLKQSCPEHIRTSILNARRSSSRVLELVNDLLDFEKLDSGIFNVRCIKTSLFSILEQSLALVQAIADKRQITIECPVNDLELEVDEDRIVQVMVNLLSNAIKFSEEGSVVQITASSENGFVEIKVIDSGRGVPDSWKPLVFERYKQVLAEDGQSGKGTGLGLPICKAIIAQHDGEIGVVDSPTKGSTFWFRLPQYCALTSTPPS